jgi:hypothetical protein
MVESDYTHAEPLKPIPDIPVRVFVRSQLLAALRQRSRPIIIEDPDLALPFIRMLKARELRPTTVGGVGRCYIADIEAYWYIGQYLLPGKVQRVILKPKTSPVPTLGSRVSAHSPRYRQ